MGTNESLNVRSVVGALLALVAFALVVMLSGCGGSTGGSSQGGASASGTTVEIQATVSSDEAETETETSETEAGTETEPAASQATEGATASNATAVIDTRGQLSAFAADTLDGGTFTLANIAAYDVTVLNFWSTGCTPCVNEMPAIAALAERLPGNVQVVTFCFDGSSSSARAQEILDTAGFTGPTLISASDSLYSLCASVRYTPTTVFIASDGTLVGNVLVGVPSDLESSYLQSINLVLEWQGKEAVSLDAA